MSHLKLLKQATNLKDVAAILGFKPKALAFILYSEKKAKTKYHTFEIKKRSGGTRVINAPSDDLKNLQSRLSDLLQNCLADINKERKISSALSHGFRREFSIITNADVHKNRRYVFNIDLVDFFGTINFGRVRGFFIKNNHFKLDEFVATILAQIACYDNGLPQGSPCSPVISNLIAHVLDIRLSKLALDTGCQYSRYADDLTFSTNKPEFPSEIARLIEGETNIWEPGNALMKVVQKAGFEINPAKTRMQFEQSRQDVTGLVVNKFVNTRVEYRRMARAMTHRLLKHGSFTRKKYSIGDNGEEVVEEVEGTIEHLNGVLSFINSPRIYRIHRFIENSPKKGDDKPKINSSEVLKEFPLGGNEKTYADFIFYRDFHAPSSPLIVCEGKTDNIYLKAALRQKLDKFPELAGKHEDGKIYLKIRFFRFSDTTARILNLTGGIGELCKILNWYKRMKSKIDAPQSDHPVILFTDNDSGAKGKGGIFNKMKSTFGVEADGKDKFYYLGGNLYVVPTPLGKGGADTAIEDFFSDDTKSTKIGKKSFNPSKHGFDSKKEYGKYVFAEQVVRKQQAKINFDGFEPVLERIQAVINAHAKKVAK